MSGKMEALEKLMAKKQTGEKMDPEHKKVKMGVLKGLHSEMGKLMGEDVKGIKKVTVAAPDKEGLAMGLDKAEDMLEASEEDSEEAPAMTAEEIEAKIAELQALKMSLSK